LHTDPIGGSANGDVGVVDVRGVVTAGRRGRRDRESGAPSATTLVTLVARALRLERVALLVEESPGGTLRPVATHGHVHLACAQWGQPPDDGPWSHTIAIGPEERPVALLLLARRGGAPLPPADIPVAEETAEILAGLVGRMREESDVAFSRELLARADRLSALGTLAAGLAHEIRNPLVSVRAFIELLPERLADDEFRTTFRDLALTEVGRICDLLSDLLAFARPSPADREPTDLGELVGQIVRLLEPEARKRDVHLAASAEPSLPLVVVDDAQVKQVLMNVILNAIEACPTHGRVEIATRVEDRPDGAWCTVDVADSGAGITPEDEARIFEPFFTTKEAGSGLGLFIARRIVGEHGGRIVTTPRPGGGTVFSIHFPVEASIEHVDAGAI
jgi:signal transduction histidine kinase